MFDDLVEDVRLLIDRFRLAAGLRSTAPPLRRGELRPTSHSMLESMRTFAHSELLAQQAFARPDVQLFWHDRLRSRWLSPEEADRFLASPLARLVPFRHLEMLDADIAHLDSRFVGDGHLQDDGSWRIEVEVPSLGQTWSSSGSIVPDGRQHGLIVEPDRVVIGDDTAWVRDAAGHVFNVGYWWGSTLARLREIAAELTKSYAWEECEGIWFLVTGQAPLVRPLTARMIGDATGRLQITMSPWITDDTLLSFVRQARRKARGRTVPKTNAMSFEVYTFVERATRSTGGERPLWKTMLADWNRIAGGGHRFADAKQMQKMYRAAARVLHQSRVAAVTGAIGAYDPNKEPGDGRDPP